MNTQTSRTFAVAACTALLLAACSGALVKPDDQFGNAVRAAMAAQTINPDASRNTKTPAGLDGAAAKSTMDRYEKSFASPPPPVNVFTIGIGNASSSGTAGQ